MDNFKKGGIKFNSNLTATNRLFAKNPLLKKRRKKATGIYDPNAKYRFDNGGVITQKEIDAANAAMMKAKLAYAYMHGNPAANRMIVATDQPYDFGNGMTGTHYMASMDNYAVPQIQDVNGRLQFLADPWSPENVQRSLNQSIIFNGSSTIGITSGQITPNIHRLRPVARIQHIGKTSGCECFAIHA